MDINGSAAIITGGGTGMGRATAQALAAAGARLALLGRRQAVVDQAAAEFGGLGIACDVADAEQVSEAVKRARLAHGPARILVNCAADGRLLPMLDPAGAALPLEPFEEILRTNLVGPFNLIRLCCADMTELEPLADGIRGVVINVSSLAGSDGAQGAVAYTASKAGLNGLTLSLARELSRFGIRVVTIAPGPFDTPMAEDFLPEEIRQMMVQMIPLPNRIGRPSEFARLAQHVIENDFINGCVIRIDAATRAPYMPMPAG